MDKFLPLLLSYFVILQNKFHNIHTNAKWPEFWYMHPIFWDIYAIFGDDAIDAIRERALQLHIDIPNTLDEYQASAKIKELTVVPSISNCISIVLNDLSFMEKMLAVGIAESNEDIVTQNMLADFQKEIGTRRWKFEMATPA